MPLPGPAYNQQINFVQGDDVSLLFTADASIPDVSLYTIHFTARVATGTGQGAIVAGFPVTAAVVDTTHFSVALPQALTAPMLGNYIFEARRVNTGSWDTLAGGTLTASISVTTLP